MKNEMIYQENLYPYKLIEQAARDYGDICHIGLKRTEEGCRCVFSDGKTDMDRIMLEFSNYLLELVGSGAL